MNGRPSPASTAANGAAPAAVDDAKRPTGAKRQTWAKRIDRGTARIFGLQPRQLDLVIGVSLFDLVIIGVG